MTRVRKLKPTRAAACVVVTLGSLTSVVVSSPAQSLALSGVKVELPAVSVKAPPVALVTPIGTIKAPEATVKAPPVAVTAPPATVNTPRVTVTTPAVTVKTQPVTIKAPPAAVKTPPIAAKAPPVTAKTTIAGTTSAASARAPGVSARAPLLAAAAPSVVAGGPTGTPSHSVTRPGGNPDAQTTSRLSQAVSRGAEDATQASSVAARKSDSGVGGYGTSPSTGSNGEPGPSPLLPVLEGAASPAAQARLVRRERKLKEAVERFKGCLGDLPGVQRELLELRTGIGLSRPLSPSAAAARLHLSRRRFRSLEKRAVLGLSEAANSHGCAQTVESGTGSTAFVSTTLSGSQPVATGGVAAARYSKPPPRSPQQTTVGRILGTGITPLASHLILILLALLVGASTVALVLADAAGQGPRHEQWRQRVINRVRAWR
jgi:DNA-directed RNA polymerase specialized sigma24 family protein